MKNDDLLVALQYTDVWELSGLSDEELLERLREANDERELSIRRGKPVRKHGARGQQMLSVVSKMRRDRLEEAAR